MKFANVEYTDLSENDILICAFGFEPRSTYLYAKNSKTRNNKNTLVFLEENCNSVDIDLENNISSVICAYGDAPKAIGKIIDFLRNIEESQESPKIHIDYSFMPRSWYCSLPEKLTNAFPNMSFSFWYVAGEYPKYNYSYPSAGINEISFFSGMALPAVDIKRVHFLGLGFDSTRTETVKSIVEADSIMNIPRKNEQLLRTS